MSRIIAGSAKGRRLETPKGDRTRPTTDRVREALFSALASWFGTAEEAADEHLDDVAILDLYAGSGAIALESMSRGARRVVAVEADAATARLVRGNAKQVGLPVEVVAAKLPGALAQVSGQFDLVFADPPYDIRDEDVAALLGGIVAGEKLLPKALVIVERSKRSNEPDWPSVFTQTWSRRYGETVLFFGATD
jgi:16S rRNA (guanine966-N2)-methyltransferase